MDTISTCLSQNNAIDIEFQDLTYSIPQAYKDIKTILRGISGHFHSGELTAILGPSGSGKSTLLNILAGYKCHGASGLITINGVPRNMKEFKRISRYIMQQDILQPWLTVQECMLIAADLKLTNEKFTKEDKLNVITNILDTLRLSKTCNTMTDQLSGGEKKRVAIALELINNPPLLFLDEPTTGLDDSACFQCISLLKTLAQTGGRTIVCSIHTPSAKLFAMFDHIYILSEGQCVFQGIGTDIVPFLSTIDLQCPIHYNPADFIMDVASGEYGKYIDKLITLTENGKIRTRSSINNKLQINNHDRSIDETHSNINKISIAYDDPSFHHHKKHFTYNKNEFWNQFKILIYRMSLQCLRNKTSLAIRLGMYIFIGFVVGAMFYKIGQDASVSFSNFCFIFISNLVFMYCPLLPSLLHFPMELQLIKREYLNRWYNLNSYYWALTVTHLPAQFIFATIYVTIAYWLTDQPLEMTRIIKFLTICILTGLVSEAIGLAISSTLNMIHGMFMGPAMMAAVIILAGYGTGMNDINIPILIRISLRLTYLRYSMEGLTAAVYGSNRGKIPCPIDKEFCIFTHAQDMMNYYSLGASNFWICVIVLISFYIGVKFVGFYLLRQRLKPTRMFATIKMIGLFMKNKIIISK